MQTTRVTKALRALSTQRSRGPLLRERVVPSYELIDVLQHAGEVATVIDVGANRGQFSLLARELWPHSTIHAFEPLANPAAVFARIHGADRNVHLHQVALSERGGESEMHVAGRDDSSSLLPIGIHQTTAYPESAEVGRERVRTAKVEEILDMNGLRTPLLLKLDVQGYEDRLLAAMSGSLVARAEFILCELSFVELYAGQALAGRTVRRLTKEGFDVAAVGSTAVHPGLGAIQCDFLFKRPST